MTNEPNANFFRNLKLHYHIFTLSDFKEFQKIKLKDNYLLFCIENEIMNNAKVKIKTFREEGYLSLLNYGPNGKIKFHIKVFRKLKKLFKTFEKRRSRINNSSNKI